ncbi:PWWP domain-containing protein 2B [Astyanax mexicanus]|uniref:PWWP domain-containing protein 2B n=1 Tax=Astyanax mexicanus TaxID=7994 RepID=UPI0020CB486C|nr:PWWP domain-containing protein 2B [Astyanax mexicanus]XP_049337600.1 PWWP domain-containing protein 2B [Astyanax mexicanus]XP_049337601.1 PWWP domain-containing protein 2B [Astyanax mexicanus]XP_049337602.1 PWWP domain-containing protein 2B [Astyanax mexicanus]
MLCNCPGGADGVIPCPCVASRALLGEGDQELRPTRAPPAAEIEQRQAGHAGHLDSGSMEAVAEELRAGSRIPVTIEQIVNDTLVVTLTYRERNYTGILLECSKKTGLFCLPDVVGKTEEPFTSKQECEVLNEEPCSKPPIQPAQRPKDENTEPEKTPCAPIPVPVLPGQTTYPPYFEGAPFPQPMWVRHTYNQWVPQPPPRPIKRKKRRSREPGRMTMSTIRLRPRQVLCEKCKNTVTSDEDSKDGSTVAKTSRKENAPQGEEHTKEAHLKGQRKEDGDTTKESKRREDAPGYESKRFRKERKEDDKFTCSDIVPHSPVIKISYSTPQGKGEVMKIPSRVHGSVKPFCPKQLMQNGEHDSSREPKKELRSPMNSIRTGLTVSIPKLKLPKLSDQDIPSPKIRLRSRGDGEERVSVYEAELVADPRRKSPRVPAPDLPKDSGEEKNPLELWSGSSGEEGERHGDLTLLINFRKRKADSSSLSVCSSDSLDESKSFSSDGTSPELCDLAPGDVSSSSSTRESQGKTVPPLTVRLHTRSMSKCLTEEGHAVTVGDVVWGKIHGFPWWPARVLSINGSRRDEGEMDAPWPEAKVSWFGSPTTSQLSVAKLSPFREFFRLRFNRRKKGMYRRAIIEAAKAVGHMSTEIASLLSHCET